MRGETERQDVRHQWRRDQHSAHETRHLTSECARSLLVSFVQSCIVIFTHCTPHPVAQVVRVFALISSMHEVSVTLRLWALHSIQLPLLFVLPLLSILLQSPAVPAALLLPRGLVVTLCTPPTMRCGLRTNPSPTHQKPTGPKGVSRAMSGIIFFVCSTLWFFQCLPAAILGNFFPIRSGSSAPCQREDKKHNIRISSPQYLTEVFHFLPQELGITTGHATFAIEAINTMYHGWPKWLQTGVFYFDLQFR